MSPKSEKRLYLLLDVIALIALAGMTLLIIRAQSLQLALFEMLAFSVSITAVTLGVLGAINNIRQRRVMQRMAKEMHEAIAEIKDLHKDNQQIQQTLHEDSAMLAKEIAEILAEAGVADNDTHRHAIAKDIEQKVRSRTTRHKQ